MATRDGIRRAGVAIWQLEMTRGPESAYGVGLRHRDLFAERADQLFAHAAIIQCPPKIVEVSFAMSDAHGGCALTIGGVADMDPEFRVKR